MMPLLLAACSTQIGCDQAAGEAGAPLTAPSDAASGPLPEISKVPAFELENEDGRPFGSKALAGQAYVVAFMFTRCPSICPELTRKMKQVDDAAKRADKRLQLVSISVDPDNDRPEVLRAYAKKHGADVDNWAFLTGDYKTILKTSEEGFKVGLSGSIDEGKPHLGITHGSHLVLVDEKGVIRGYFRSSDEDVAGQIVTALDHI